MNKDILDQIKTDIQDIHSEHFDLIINTGYTAPTQDDSSITHENFITKEKKIKSIDCCILFIDIRKSTKISFDNSPKEMAKLYSSFTRSMIRCATEFDGKVRNIIGDRILVVFDSYDCCEKAVKCGLAMNTVSKYINSEFSGNTIKCGIGVAHGRMYVTKCGRIKRGDENSHYKSLVWVGSNANIASKLCDMANKSSTYEDIPMVRIARQYKYISDEWHWTEEEFKIFFEKLDTYKTPNLKYPDDNMVYCYATMTRKKKYEATPSLIITEEVYKDFKLNNKEHDSISKSTWSRVYRKIDGAELKYYGTSYRY